MDMDVFYKTSFTITNKIKKGNSKMKKRTIMKALAALLTASMCMTACGNAEVSESTDSAKESSAEVSSESSTEVTEEPKAYWEMLGEVSDTSELPDWEGETLEVKLWVAGGTDRILGTIPDTNVTFKELERVTGIVFNVEESYGNGGEGIDAKLPKIIASKDYPTIVYSWGADAQMRELFDNGYLVDLTEYYDNGDLSSVEYWMPREYGKNTVYANKYTEDGSYYLLPAEFSPGVLYETSGYTVDEYDSEYYAMYGATPKAAGGFGSTQSVWVRDDILTAIYPDALTLDDIQEIYLENGEFTKEEVFDIGLETTDDFYQFLRDIKEELASGNYVGLDGKTMEVTYGPNTESDNWDWLYMLPSYVDGNGANADYFSRFVNDGDASTPLFVKGWEDDKMVDFMRNLNALVNEDVISANSLVDNSATFKEKVTNAHYAVVYGNSARSSLPKESEYEALVEWGYRPVYLSQLPDATSGGLATGGIAKASVGIFKDALTEEQLEQLIHAFNYLASPVGKNCFTWGPASAGLFTEDAEGNRTYTDAELEANILYKKDNEAAYKYGIIDGTCSTQTLFVDGISVCTGLGGNLLDAQYLSRTNMDRVKEDATNYFNPGIFTEYSYNSNTSFMTTDVTLYGFGVSNVEGIKEWWTARPGFEKQLTKIMVASPSDFDAELAELSSYSESVGLTDEAMNEFNQKFIEANKEKLDAAGIVY